MQRKLTPATTLDNLRKDAKRWLKALRENDPQARERLQRAYPKVSGHPVLRDVQHALALPRRFRAAPSASAWLLFLDCRELRQR